MVRLVALWAAVLAVFLLMWVSREERLAARGKVPLGRLRRFWLRSERRRAPRYRVDWIIRYERLEPPPARGNGKTRDVSRSGAGLMVPEKLPIGSLIRLEVTPPDQGPLLEMRAEVVWLKEVALDGEGSGQVRQFFIGIRFCDVPPTVEQQISQALRGHASF